MKKFECAHCLEIATNYLRFHLKYKSMTYYIATCDYHKPLTDDADEYTITYEEFVAAKAMEAL